MRKVIFCLMLFFFNTAMAWNMVGHRVVGQIAYENLTPQAKLYFNDINHAMDVVYKPTSFANAASWMDEIRYRDIDTYTTWHYIDIPFSNDNTPLPTVDTVNAKWALEQSYSILSSDKSNDFEKGFYFRVMLHILGDIHQPLHTTARISRSLPYGDKGGNLVKLAANPIATNLHSYWDRGAGVFYTRKKQTRKKSIRQLARMIQNQYPRNDFDIDEIDFDAWVIESNLLAREQVYQINDGDKPSRYYQKMAKNSSKRQVAKAGYRLALVFNTLVAEQGFNKGKNQ